MTLTQERVLGLFRYDADTGVLTRLSFAGARGLVGEEPGYVNAQSGYRIVMIDGKNYRAHRVAWLWMTGSCPSVIDHINGNRADNRWTNLREATGAMNAQNQRRPRADNKTGFLGVLPNGTGFAAQIQANGKSIHLGTFRTPELAHAAYVAAKREHHQGGTL
jgi:hypothetical protein